MLQVITDLFESFPPSRNNEIPTDLRLWKKSESSVKIKIEVSFFFLSRIGTLRGKNTFFYRTGLGECFCQVVQLTSPVDEDSWIIHHSLFLQIGQVKDFLRWDVSFKSQARAKL